MPPEEPAFQPTPLDIALSQDPAAEAASREVADASQPPDDEAADWPQLDKAARDLDREITQRRKQLTRRITFPPLAIDE
jgi:hypothetical protein